MQKFLQKWHVHGFRLQVRQNKTNEGFILTYKKNDKFISWEQNWQSNENDDE